MAQTQPAQPSPAMTPLDNPGAVQAQQAAWMMTSPGLDQAQAQQSATSPALARLAQTPPQGNDVWVTVPVDKVTVAKGRGTVQPVYGPVRGQKEQYQPDTPGSAIPPVVPAGRP